MSELHPSGSISTASHPAAGSAEDTIAALDGFWPVVLLSEYRAHYRDDHTRSDAEVKTVLHQAVQTITGELSAWVAKHKAAGKTSHTQTGQVSDRGVPINLAASYKAAVYHEAKAQTLELWQDFDSTGKGSDRSEQLLPRIIASRRLSHNAIADILGRTRGSVRLL